MRVLFWFTEIFVVPRKLCDSQQNLYKYLLNCIAFAMKEHRHSVKHKSCPADAYTWVEKERINIFEAKTSLTWV